MKNQIIIALLSVTGVNAFATNAKIYATDENEKRVVFALDSKNAPRINGDQKSYPTIKDFRDGSDYYDACYVGNYRDVRSLLNELVMAADSDGDSWAEVKSIKKAKSDVIEVVAMITDESGENEEVFTFAPCK